MKTIGLARMGRDAEIRHTPAGEAVCNLSLAFNYGQKRQDGSRATQWIDAALWGKRAEVLAPFLLQGTSHCFTLDDIHIEEFEGKNGIGHKLVARVVDVELGPRAGAAPASGGEQQQRPAAQPADARPAQSSALAGDFDDSDIPF